MQPATSPAGTIIDPAAAFDGEMARRAPALSVRAEIPNDLGFLIDLFCACSPMAGQLPPFLLEQQARLQIGAHTTNHPAAMRRIIGDGHGPTGRIMVDWSGTGAVHGIDIAVLPDRRVGAAGVHMMRSWLEVADTLGRPARIEVVADNPARRLYERLGFRATSDGPIIEMLRDAPPARARYLAAR